MMLFVVLIVSWRGQKERAPISLACKQALLLEESREVTRESQAKGDARGPLARALSRGPLEIESLLARRPTFFDLTGRVAEWPVRRTRNAAVPGSSSALSSATLVTFPKLTTEACFFKISLSSVSMQPSSWAISKSWTPHFQTSARPMASHSSLSATTGYNFGQNCLKVDWTYLIVCW